MRAALALPGPSAGGDKGENRLEDWLLVNTNHGICSLWYLLPRPIESG